MYTNNSGDIFLLILIGILVIVVWAGIVVATRVPRIEMLTRGVYEEMKRVYDELERQNGRHSKSSLLCRSCGNPLVANVRFCSACGQPASQTAASE